MSLAKLDCEPTGCQASGAQESQPGARERLGGGDEPDGYSRAAGPWAAPTPMVRPILSHLEGPGWALTATLLPSALPTLLPSLAPPPLERVSQAPRGP